MKPKQERQPIIDQIGAVDSPVGMDAVYVHALILDYLRSLSERLESVEQRLEKLDRNA